MRMRRSRIGCPTSRSSFTPRRCGREFVASSIQKPSVDVLTALNVLIEPNVAELVDGNSLVTALENIELVPSEFFVSRYYETLEHQLSTIYRQFMLVYEDCRHEESTPQVRAMERAFKRSSEGQRLNKLIREKNVDGFLPRSVGAYMNAAEGLASEAEAVLRKARKYTDAVGGKLSAPVTGSKRRNQPASTHKQKCPGCGSFDHGYKECVYQIHPYFNADPSIEYAQSPMGIRYYNKYEGIKKRDMDHIMHKNDRGGRMQRKRLRQEDLAALPSKSLVCVSKWRALSAQSRQFLGPSRNVHVYPGSSERSPHW